MERQEQIHLALVQLFPEIVKHKLALAEDQAVLDIAVSLEGKEGATVPEAAASRQPGILNTDPTRCGTCLDVLCLPDQVYDVAQILDGQGLFLETITGVDWPELEQIELLYDYNQMASPSCRVLVRTFLQRNAPILPSITNIFPGANWHERETYDFFGVQFANHPKLTRILLPEDADFYPLLKDYMP